VQEGSLQVGPGDEGLKVDEFAGHPELHQGERRGRGSTSDECKGGACNSGQGRAGEAEEGREKADANLKVRCQGHLQPSAK